MKIWYVSDNGRPGISIILHLTSGNKHWLKWVWFHHMGNSNECMNNCLCSYPRGYNWIRVYFIKSLHLITSLHSPHTLQYKTPTINTLCTFAYSYEYAHEFLKHIRIFCKKYAHELYPLTITTLCPFHHRGCVSTCLWVSHLPL